MSYLRRNPIGDTEEKSKGSRNWKEIWLGKTGNAAGEIAKMCSFFPEDNSLSAQRSRQQNVKVFLLWSLRGQSSGFGDQTESYTRELRREDSYEGLVPKYGLKCWLTIKPTLTKETWGTSKTKQNKNQSWKLQTWGKCQLLTAEGQVWSFEFSQVKCWL